VDSLLVVEIALVEGFERFWTAGVDVSAVAAPAIAVAAVVAAVLIVVVAVRVFLFGALAVYAFLDARALLSPAPIFPLLVADVLLVLSSPFPPFLQHTKVQKQEQIRSISCKTVPWLLFVASSLTTARLPVCQHLTNRNNQSLAPFPHRTVLWSPA